MDVQLFFGASTGRTAAMQPANCLDAAQYCACVHGGKFRHREASGEPLSPVPTPESRMAYVHTEKARDIIDTRPAFPGILRVKRALKLPIPGGNFACTSFNDQRQSPAGPFILANTDLSP